MRGMTTACLPLELGPMPVGRQMTTVDEQLVRAPLERIFRLAAEVERWPALLPHYRYVRFIERRSDGGGIVEMSAIASVRRACSWPTWWTSRMRVHPPMGPVPPSIRFTHIEGITKGMEVEWTFTAVAWRDATCASCMFGMGRRWSAAGARGRDDGDRSGVRARDREPHARWARGARGARAGDGSAEHVSVHGGRSG